MLAEIVTIGDEILIGQIVDTNSAFLARNLNRVGVDIHRITSIPDDREQILDALEAGSKRVPLIILTGGLGPTNDDLTKPVLNEFLGDQLKRNPEVLAHIEYLFREHITSTPISDMNRAQADLPSTVTPLHNPYGTAPGMWAEKNGTVIISLPGVPMEMEHLLKEEVIPRIAERFDTPYIFHRTLITYGLGESAIAERLTDIEENLPDGIKLAYLPNFGKVRIRVSGRGRNEEQLLAAMDGVMDKLIPRLEDILQSEEGETDVEEEVAKLLTEKKLSLATAESFTGGAIAERITRIPGASTYFKGSIVSYATAVKIKQLGIPEKVISEHTVVSEAVARMMAENVRKELDAHIGIATTGEAGPTRGDSDAPVGTAWIAIATPKGVVAHEFHMGNQRTRIIQKSVHKAFEMLRKEILKF